MAAHNDGLRPAVVALYQTGFGSVGFRRGFPDSLTVTAYWGYNGPADWPAALLPLRELRLAGPVTSEWDRFAEARFAGVSRVVLSDWGDG